MRKVQLREDEWCVQSHVVDMWMIQGVELACLGPELEFSIVNFSTWSQLNPSEYLINRAMA